MRLSVKNLSAFYGKKKILHDISFPDVRGGMIVGLLGPNASGKSTLMKCLSGEKKSKGDVVFDGENLHVVGGKRWSEKVATMPQTAPAPTALTPTELMWSTARALALPYSNRELSWKIERIFDDLGLSDFQLDALHTLSGGKRQLIGLALAFIREPELLLLDEPTSALDLHWRMIVLDLVKNKVQQSGSVSIAALHDLDLAARYCDLLALMENGKVIASGTPKEVLTRDNLARVYHVKTEIDLSKHGYPRVDVIGAI
ncbi:cobalamin ABC transporter ATPase [Kiloniella spongiae]|uniref:Cobalamin ABC transporter ATPase n=1 Tax=Kiloniella spongiae TaxID=1489064 RepID=A0A0H2MGG6_9PROT|nr:ABC transporter ATP-binding protein [Kiloniella spongiae]KLN59862.1 cobalamin ABC transporter ATPase [Kiloniella spongiae]